MTTVNLNDQVVRSKGDYVVGRTGTVIALDLEKKRAQVQWDEDPKSWVAFTSLELKSLPYEIIPGFLNKKKGYYTNPKYKRLAF